MRKKNKGFTLVELIVAMFIITLVVTSIIPMLLIGYKQIISSGKKNVSIYTTQKQVEDVLAGNNNDYTDVSITHDDKNAEIDLVFDSNPFDDKYTGQVGNPFTVKGRNLEITYNSSFNIKTFKPN